MSRYSTEVVSTSNIHVLLTALGKSQEEAVSGKGEDRGDSEKRALGSRKMTRLCLLARKAAKT